MREFQLRRKSLLIVNKVARQASLFIGVIASGVIATGCALSWTRSDLHEFIVTDSDRTCYFLAAGADDIAVSAIKNWPIPQRCRTTMRGLTFTIQTGFPFGGLPGRGGVFAAGRWSSVRDMSRFSYWATARRLILKPFGTVALVHAGFMRRD